MIEKIAGLFFYLLRISRSILLMSVLGVCMNANSQALDEQIIPIVDDNEYLIKESTLFIDSYDGIWMSTSESLIRIVGDHKIFYSFPQKESKPKFIYPTTIRLKQVSSTTILGQSNLGLFKVNLELAEIIWIDSTIDFSKVVLGGNKLIELGNNMYFTTHDNQVVQYNIKTENLEIFNLPYSESLRKENNGNNHLVIQQIIDNKLLILSNLHHYFSYDFRTITKISDFKLQEQNKFQFISKNGQIFTENTSGTYKIKNKNYSYWYDATHNIQIYQMPKKRTRILKSKKGVFIVNKDIEDKTLDIMTLNKKTDSFLIRSIKSKYNISDYVFHKENIIIAKHEAGISVFRTAKNEYFEAIIKKPNVNYSSRSMVKTENGDLYIASYQGVFILKNGHHYLKKVQFKNKKTGRLLHDRVLYGAFLWNDSTLIGYGHARKIFRLNLRTRTYRTIELPTQKLRNFYRNVKDIERIDHNSILIVGHFGAMIYDFKTKTFHDFSLSKKGTHKKEEMVLDAFFNKKSKDLWLGLANVGTIIKQNLLTNEKHIYSNDCADYSIANDVTAIVPDEHDNETLWVGTTNGLKKIKNGIVSNENAVYGLGASSNITGILQTKNILWIGTYNGLVQYDIVKKKRKIYYVEDGLPCNEFNKKSFLKLNNDTLYFGGVKGVVLVKASNFNNEIDNKEIILAEAVYFDKKKKKTINQTFGLKEIRTFAYPSDRNFIQFKFVSNVPFETMDELYYRLTNISEDWFRFSKGELVIHGLNPGRHKLQIKTVNEASTSSVFNYNLDITQPFYRQAWFALMLGITIAFLIIRYFQERKGKLRQKWKFELVKSTLFRFQVPSHLTLNIINNLQSAFLLEDRESINTLITGYATFIRQSINMRVSEYVPLADELEYVHSYLALEKKRLNNNLTYKFKVSQELYKENILLPSLLIQPLVENAIKHGLVPKKNDRELIIQLHKSQSSLFIEIIDNGIGVQKESNENNKQYGSFLISERIRFINSIEKISIKFNIVAVIENGKSKGTKAVIIFPLKSYKLD